MDLRVTPLAAAGADYGTLLRARAYPLRPAPNRLRVRLRAYRGAYVLTHTITRYLRTHSAYDLTHPSPRVYTPTDIILVISTIADIIVALTKGVYYNGYSERP